MKNILFIIICLLGITRLQAQDHPYAISLRGAYTSGVGLQFFTAEHQAIEGMISWRDEGVQLTVLKEHYRPVFLKKSDHFYLGLGYGAHLGYEWRRSWHPNSELPSHYFRSGPGIGVDGLLSLEYCFYRVPFSIGITYQPFAEFSTTRFFRLNLWDCGLVVRYRFASK